MQKEDATKLNELNAIVNSFDRNLLCGGLVWHSNDDALRVVAIEYEK